MYKKIFNNLHISISRNKVNIFIWFYFFRSLVKYKNQKKILLYSLVGWHLGSQQNKRKEIYKEWIHLDKNYHTIDINFENTKMLKFFNYWLNTKFKYNKIKLRNLMRDRIPNKILATTESIKLANWDIKSRDLHNNKEKNYLPLNYTNSKDNFYLFCQKNKIDKSKYRELIRLSQFNNLEFIYTEDSYEEWSNVIVFYKYKKKIYNFENIYGFIEISQHENLTLEERLNNLFKKLSTDIEKKYLEIAKTNLNNRVKGIYNSASLFHTKRPDIINRKYYKIKNIKENALFLFCHAFADASNKRAFKASSFSSYYEMSLFIIEFAIENNYPLYIKFHPTRYSFNSEQKFNLSLKKALLEKKKMNPNFYYELIEDEFNNDELLNLKNVIAITGRGTISIECGYLGIPIINMFRNFDNFNFCYNYDDYKNLNNLIKDIKLSYDKKKSKEDAIKMESILEKINQDRLIEFINISKETGKIKKIDRPFLTYSNII